MESPNSPRFARQSLRVLALEPYFGGSHQAFLDGWSRHSRHNLTLVGLPAHNWKWRMRHGAVTLAEEVTKRVAAGDAWDVLFCSDMLNLAELRGLCPAAAAMPAVVYFHENQLTYPVLVEDKRDFHFAYTNFTSCLAADAVWFNSAFHRNEFLTALRALLRRMPDHHSLEKIDTIAQRSVIQPPGVADDFPPRGNRAAGPLRIVWAARWEHDKNPDDFFAALEILAARGIDFRVSVIGAQFRDAPAVFAEYRQKHHMRIDRWGYQPSRDDYRQALADADVFVSTAQHEFFGIAAVEAMAAGCLVLLPNRLAYPELLGHLALAPGEFLYDGAVDALAASLANRAEQLSAAHSWETERQQLQSMASQFFWPRRSLELDSLLESVCAATKGHYG